MGSGLQNGIKYFLNIGSDFTAYDDNIDGLKEFLRTLAWSGLTARSAFDTLYPDNTLDRQAIQKLIQDEIFPDDGDATPKGDSPVPCN